MKLTLKLPDGGRMTFEKKPMSDRAREDLWMSIIYLIPFGMIPLLIWLLR